MSETLRRVLDSLRELRAVCSFDEDVEALILAEADAAIRDGEALLAQTEEDTDADA